MTSKKTAFITGILGQDGAYLTQFLLEKNYEVHGLIRWDSCKDAPQGMDRFQSLGIREDQVSLHFGDLADAQNVTALIQKIQPDEIYNLGALTQVAVSFQTPAATFDVNVKGALAILEAVRILGMKNSVRIYQASSSEMFGSVPSPQNEDTPMHPCSPYGVSKLAAYWMAKNYRDAYGIYVANGVLFNHESPQRGEDFVTRKITRAVAEIEMGRAEPISLGNLDSKRDWGHSRDYVRGMWMLLQQTEARDYVLATGEAIRVRDFVNTAFEYVGITLQWQGEGLEEIGCDRRSGKALVRVDEAFFRPNDVNDLLGDASKARIELGWQPEITLRELIGEMINADRSSLRMNNMDARDTWQSVG